MSYRFSIGDVIRVRDALAAFRDDLSEYVNANGVLPHVGSPATREQETFPRTESVWTVYSQCLSLQEVTADQLTAFLKTISEPFETIAPWVTVRAMLEAGALTAWLLDPTIDVVQRVRRSLALRYEGLDQQQKFVRSAGQSDTLDRMGEFVEEARALGFHVISDRRGKRIGVGMAMPSATELVSGVLDEESMYRLLSAIAHGHFWAVSQAGFRVIPDHPVPAGNVPLKAISKSINPDGIVYLALGAAKAIGLGAWFQSQYCGWDAHKMVDLLEQLFGKLQAAPHLRFWVRP